MTGRQFTLTLTIFLIAGSTFLIGVLPTYQSVGLLAPVLLVLLRMVQGFSAGGEYGGAATFMAEYAPDRRRGLFGSFLEVGAISGFTLAIVVVGITEASIGSEAMTAWGWRIPFLIAAPLGLIGFYMRRRLEDTPVFRELASTGKVEEKAANRFRDLVVTYWRPLLTLGGLTIALNVANYTLLTYTPTYLQETIGMDSGNADLLIVGQSPGQRQEHRAGRDASPWSWGPEPSAVPWHGCCGRWASPYTGSPAAPAPVIRTSTGWWGRTSWRLWSPTPTIWWSPRRSRRTPGAWSIGGRSPRCRITPTS